MGRPRLPNALRGERGRAVGFLAAWIGSLFLVWSLTVAAMPKPIAPAGPFEATLRIEGGTWTIGYHAVSMNNSVFRFLREASVALGFELGWVEYPAPYNDVFVTSINGTRMDGVRAWQYCVNGAYATVGAAAHELRDGDTVTWVFAPGGGDELCA